MARSESITHARMLAGPDVLAPIPGRKKSPDPMMELMVIRSMVFAPRVLFSSAISFFLLCFLLLFF